MKTAALTPTPGWDTIFKNPQAYTYYDLSQAHQDLPMVIKFFKEKKVHKILDLGCGLGNNLFPLQTAGFVVTGLDASKTAINSIQSQASKAKISVDVTEGNFQKLPYADQTFDAVISVQTLNHGYEAEVKQGIGEISRVLKPNGLVFMTLPGRISQGKIRYCLVKTATKVEEHTYLPTIGDETGVPHVIYNKDLIQDHFRNFKQLKMWRDSKDYYCFLAERNS